MKIVGRTMSACQHQSTARVCHLLKGRKQRHIIVKNIVFICLIYSYVGMGRDERRKYIKIVTKGVCYNKSTSFNLIVKIVCGLF